MKKFIFGFSGLIILLILSAIIFGTYHSALSTAMGYLGGVAAKIVLDRYFTVG